MFKFFLYLLLGNVRSAEDCHINDGFTNLSNLNENQLGGGYFLFQDKVNDDSSAILFYKCAFSDFVESLSSNGSSGGT